MLCIFSRLEKPPSIEHVVADSLGGTLTIDRVCRECNNEFGTTVDHLLTDHLFADFGRVAFGISDERKLMSRIFGNGTLHNGDGTASAVRVIGTKNPTSTSETSPANVTKPYVVPDVAAPIVNADGSSTIKASFDADDEHNARAFVRANAQRAGMTFADDAAFDAYFATVATRTQIETPTINFTKAIDLVTFKPAIVKIVYECAWRWLGEAWPDDPIALEIKHAIFHGLTDTSPINGSITVGDNTHWPLKGADCEAMHVMVLTPTDQAITVSVRIFNSFSAVVVVSRAPLTYFALPITWPNGAMIILQYRNAARREEAFAAYFASLAAANA